MLSQIEIITVKKNNYKKSKGKGYDFIKVEINNILEIKIMREKQFTSVLLTVVLLWRLNFIENNSKGNFDSKYKTKYFVAGNEIKFNFHLTLKPQIPNFILFIPMEKTLLEGTYKYGKLSFILPEVY
jgi:hypothetical protein